MNAPVDLSNVQPGDEVLVRATVLRDSQHVHTVRVAIIGYGPAIEDHSASLSVTAEHVAAHTPKALAVGDEVLDSGGRATVLFVDGRHTIIRFNVEGGCIHSGPTGGLWASKLERAQ